MRELIVNTFLTLDGVMQAPGGPEEDPSGGFDHGGWSFGYWDEQMQTTMGESMSKPFDIVLGRKTYVDVPARARDRKAPVRRRHGARRRGPRELAGLLDWSGDGHLPKRRGDQVRLLRLTVASCAAPGTRSPRPGPRPRPRSPSSAAATA